SVLSSIKNAALVRRERKIIHLARLIAVLLWIQRAKAQGKFRNQLWIDRDSRSRSKKRRQPGGEEYVSPPFKLIVRQMPPVIEKIEDAIHCAPLELLRLRRHRFQRHVDVPTCVFVVAEEILRRHFEIPFAAVAAFFG